MKIGKLSENIYHRSIIKQLKTKQEQVLFDQNHGLNFSVIDSDHDDVFVISSCVRTDYFPGYEDLAIYTAMNELVTSGADMIGVMLQIVLPERITEHKLKQMIAQMEKVCAFLHIQIVGVDTKISVNVLQPIITVSSIGRQKKDHLILSTKIIPGNDLILTKWIGIEGTFMIAEKYEEELLSRYSFSFIQTAKKFREYLNLAPEAATARKSGVAAMYNVSEGGIFGALWNFAQAGGVGLEINLKKIPVKQETIELCEFYGLNPYELISGGAMLIAAEDGNGLVRNMEKEGIPATIIGKVVDGNDRIIYNGEDRRFLEPAKQDGIYQLFES